MSRLILQGDYGYGLGWEDDGEFDSLDEAAARLSDYELNCPQYRYRVIDSDHEDCSGLCRALHSLNLWYLATEGKEEKS